MGYFILYMFILLGWLLMVITLVTIFCAVIAAIIAAVIGLYYQCCPLTRLPYNPDVIPKVPPARNLLGG